MWMNTSHNVLERLKLPRFIGIEIIFNQIALYQSVTQGENLEMKNAVFSKRKTSQNWKHENRFISRSSSTSFKQEFRRPCDFDFKI